MKIKKLLTCPMAVFLISLLPLSVTAQSDNYFAGTDAGAANTTGTFNAFVGSNAGRFNTTGTSNAFIGTFAGYNNITGHSNAFIGAFAGASNTTAYNNAFFGVYSGLATTTGGNNTFMGYMSGQSNTSGYRNSFIGTNAGGKTTTGIQNTFLGYEAGLNTITGNANTAIGYAAGNATKTLTNATAIGNRAQVNTSNSLVLGSIKNTNGATASVNVGIGTSSPAYRLQVNGTVAKPGGGSWTALSDQRLKKNIQDFTDGFQVLEQIHPVTYQYNGKAGLPTEKQYVGVIAQEMQKIAPYTVGEFIYQDTTGTTEKYLDYDATALTYILVNAVKEQQTKIEALENALKAQQKELTQIKQLLLNQNPHAPLPSSAQLWQNEPNPYQEATTIRYYIPETITTAQIKFYSSTGQEVHSVNLTKKGQGEITLSNSQFASGTYVYRLFMDGQSQDSKRLILVR